MVAEAQHAAASSGVAGTLGLDYRLFLAQLVNFGIVLFVVWKWAYAPLRKAMEERAARIEKGLRDADASAELRKAAEEEKARMVAEARAAARDIMDKAEGDAKARQEEAVRKAKDEVERVVADGKQRLHDERDKMLRDAKADVAGLVLAATERLLREKVDAGKDRELIERAIHDIG